jgi:hypothetical protein
MALALYGTSGEVLAYDPSPNIGTDEGSCAEVIFDAFTPPPFSHEKKNEVAPQSEFSFLASKATLLNSITVKIKDEKIPVTMTTMHNGILVKGKLPKTAKGYIRLDIFAKGATQCDKADGWLLKVKD